MATIRDRVQSFFRAITKDIKAHEKPYDVEVAPVANKNCKDCFGRGYIQRHFDTDSGPVMIPCHCLRYVRTDGGPDIGIEKGDFK
jgi:hypothetical protein